MWLTLVDNIDDMFDSDSYDMVDTDRWWCGWLMPIGNRDAQMVNIVIAEKQN